MDRDPTYHARRANAELALSLSTDNRCAAEAHRTLTMLHVGKLMTSPDPNLRDQAAKIIAQLHGASRTVAVESMPELTAEGLTEELSAAPTIAAQPKRRAL